MAADWVEARVEQIAAPAPNALATGPFGSSIGSQLFTQSGIPLIRGSNLSEKVEIRLSHDDLVYVSEETAEKFKRSIVTAGDLVFTCWGTIGQVGLIDKRCPHRRYLISNKQMKLTPDPRHADSLFLYYLFSGPELSNRIKNQAIGSSVPGFNLGQLKALRLLLPPLPEQQAIAKTLGSIDDKIELNRRMNQTLENMAQALFRSWFVDFDPVRAKAEGQQPEGVDAETAALFPDRFVDSELGKIPEGWSPRTVADVAVVNARTLAASDPQPELEYIEISGVRRGDVLERTRYRRGEEPSRARRRVSHGDTLLSTVRPDRGAYLLALHPPEELVVSTGFAVVSPRSVPWAWLHAALTREEVFVHLGQIADGGAYPAVRPEAVASLPLVTGSPAVLERYQELVEPMLLKMEANRRESLNLARLRDTILPKLLSGEIRVREAEVERGRPLMSRSHTA